MEVKPITISFKQTEDDFILRKWIVSHSNLSGFVKDVLRKEMNKPSDNKVVSKEIQSNKGLIDLGDF